VRSNALAAGGSFRASPKLPLPSTSVSAVTNVCAILTSAVVDRCCRRAVELTHHVTPTTREHLQLRRGRVPSPDSYIAYVSFVYRLSPSTYFRAVLPPTITRSSRIRGRSAQSRPRGHRSTRPSDVPLELDRSPPDWRMVLGFPSGRISHFPPQEEVVGESCGQGCGHGAVLVGTTFRDSRTGTSFALRVDERLVAPSTSSPIRKRTARRRLRRHRV